MRCKPCNNTREFTKVDRKYHTVVYKEDGVPENEDLIPFHHVVEIFCARCKQLVIQSH